MDYNQQDLTDARTWLEQLESADEVGISIRTEFGMLIKRLDEDDPLLELILNDQKELVKKIHTHLNKNKIPDILKRQKIKID